MRIDPGTRRRAGWHAKLWLGIAASAGMVSAAPASPAERPIRIDRIGAFEAGGTTIDDGKGGTLSCDHGHVEYMIPHRPRAMSLMFWHSSSTKVWQSRWDGGEGYVSLFLRRGFPIYLWDGPRVGRANWGCAPVTYTPSRGQDERSFTAWRFGPKYPNWYPNVQFPTADKEAWNQAIRARYDEFDTVENAVLEAGAAAVATDRIGPVVLVTNSAGGLRAMVAATRAKTNNIRAIVAYETPGFVFPVGEGPQLPPGPYGPVYVSREEFKRLAAVPMQFVWGDNIESSPSWTKAVELNRAFVDLVRKYGGQAEILSLPASGLRGNTHIAFADMNNVAVADRLSAFLKRNKLDGWNAARGANPK